MLNAMRTRTWAPSLLLLAACGGEDNRRPMTEERQLDTGEGYVLVVTDGPSLSFERNGETLLRFEASSLSLGLVEVVDDDSNYDPYRLVEPTPLYDVPADLVFETPTSAEFVEGGEGITLALTYPGGVTAELTLSAAAPGHVAASLKTAGSRTAFVRLAPYASSDEGFYGLGEYFDSVDHRGKVRAMQIEADGSIESSYNEAHVPVPLLVGTRGWGLFVESPYPGAFSVAVDDPERIDATFGTGPASDLGVPFHLFGAGHPLDVTRHYYEVTGYPKLPARWALGPWVWRDENEDQAQVESDLDTIRDLDLATTGMWIDRPYASAVNAFDFEPTQFPDPDAMIAKMHALGFRTALWHTPYLDEEAPATAALVAEAEAEGYYPPQSAVDLNGWGTLIDFTNAEAKAWWQAKIDTYVDRGVEGFKLDYGEDVLNGLFFERTPWVFADGSDERTMHSQWQRLYHETYASRLDQSEGYFLLCRAGTYGDQTNGVIIWPGDLDANFAKHRDMVDEGGDSYVAVGGLPASVIAGLGLGPSGYPFYGADTGGYRHSPTDKEVFMRWFEQTALSTVMQIGTSANDVAWELGGDNGFDQELLDSYRVYTRLHLRLFPYLWTYAERLAEDGRPIQRALGLAHPELGLHPDDIYLLGDALLVAPVVERGATDKVVSFPEGRWVHWFTGEVFEGPTTATVDAPLGRLPLFLADDGVVPMLRPTIDTLAPTTEPARVDSYDDDVGVLWVRMVARGTASFTLFDGGTVAQRSDGGTSTISVESGGELDQGAIIELLAATAPSSVDSTEVASLADLEAAAEGWWFDASTSALFIKLPSGDSDAAISW
ncbi:MAG TPA: glycoside hydrolase family 31 protein [Polyangiaceae bacterium]|nr:glycoside hydrolase family 31 protein [Polyangiaceae bacterium]